MYIAPETTENHSVSTSLDAFGLGVIFLEMLGHKGIPKYHVLSNKQPLLDARNELASMKESSLVQEVILPLLQPKENRIDVEVALERLLGLAKSNLLEKEIEYLLKKFKA